MTKPDPNKENNFKETGKPRRLILIAISQEHLDEVLAYSRSDKEAADVLEDLGNGRILAPSFGRQGGAPALDQNQIEKLVSQRVENEVAKLVSRSSQAQAEQQEKIAKLEAKLAAAEEASKRKPAAAGKKKASAKRKQPKGGLVAKAKARAQAEREAAGGEPELSEEEQEHLNRVLAGAKGNEE